MTENIAELSRASQCSSTSTLHVWGALSKQSVLGLAPVVPNGRKDTVQFAVSSTRF